MPRLNNLKHSMRSSVDEHYTPSILVKPIVKYIAPNSTIWCPFDTKNSEFVVELTKTHDVIYSHISLGQDFFEYEPQQKYDCIISNPPFTLKKQVLERLYLLNKPFAIILGLPILNYQEIGAFFVSKNSDIQLLIVDKKVSFNGNTASFNNSYFCRNFLPRDILFEHLDHNNSRKHFVQSSMEKDREMIRLDRESQPSA